MMSFVLGVDGGGTNTRVAIMDDSGRLCGWGRSGPSNIDDVGRDLARANIAKAIQMAWQQAGLEPQPFSAAFFGMAGVVSPTDRQIIRDIAASLEGVPADKTGVDHDCRIALAGGLLGQPGIVLISGTGSSCYGRTAAGDDWRSGGWGHLISDEGSGYWFGIHAMRCAARAADRRDPPTLLLDAVLKRLNLTDINDIVHRLYVVGMSRMEIAELAHLVFDASAQGDTTAKGLIEMGVSALAECVSAVAQQLGMGSQPAVALTGGLHKASTTFTHLLTQAILDRLPGASVAGAAVSPALGACLLALESLSVYPRRLSNLIPD
jgi:N-acetylglucosamine kinase-like BadF-type ATPase